MNFLTKASRHLRPCTLSFSVTPMRAYHYPEHYHHHLDQEPSLIAKRVINCVGNRLRECDSH